MEDIRGRALLLRGPLRRLPLSVWFVLYGMGQRKGKRSMATPSPSPLPPVPDGLRRAAGTVLDALLPPQCLSCGTMVAAPGGLCADCWSAVTVLGPPQCAACGLPFPHDPGPDALCGACVRRAPPYDRARAAFAYDDRSRTLILGLKHRDRTDSAGPLGRWLARAGAELVADADLVAPVPLHWTRLFARRYNQAALLAYALGREAGLPVVPDLLVRRRRTPSQGTLGPAARRRNVRGAMAVRPSAAAGMAGRRVLLVDDVFTTGATAEACARTLRRAGAAAVDVLVLARVVRPAL